eukprot:m.166746 g.166746  ORF g.166746 m.166746 type:complete len:96 (-) comp53150_c0_seq14:1562-1849(-)
MSLTRSCSPPTSPASLSCRESTSTSQQAFTAGEKSCLEEKKGLRPTNSLGAAYLSAFGHRNPHLYACLCSRFHAHPFLRNHLPNGQESSGRACSR